MAWGFISSLVDFFSGRRGKDAEQNLAPAIKEDKKPVIRKSRRFTFRKSTVLDHTLEDRPISLDTSFSRIYSDSLKRRTDSYTPASFSDSQLPGNIVPVDPEVIQQESSVLHLSISVFEPQVGKTPVSTVALAAERKQIEALFLASVRQQIQEAERLLMVRQFDDARQIASNLVSSLSGDTKHASLLEEAKSLKSKIDTLHEQFKQQEAERIRREREEQERRRIERERQDRKQALLESLDRLLELARNNDWTNVTELKDHLVNEVSGFGDQQLTDALKGALTRCEDMHNAYLRRQEEIRQEQAARRAAALQAAQQRRLNELTEHVKDWIDGIRTAATEHRWSDCVLLERKVDQAFGELFDAELQEKFKDAKDFFTRVQAQYNEQQQRQAEERRRQEQEAEQRRRAELERQAREAQRQRANQVRASHIRQSLNYGGECICLHYYYKTSHGSVSYEDQKTRDYVYAFKDKFHNKSKTEINSARCKFRDELSGLLGQLYGDDIYDMWFCTAQASSPESAERRFKEFCGMMSEACGIKNGYDLIKVVGTKASASTGGGVRGDISNLRVDDSVRGKKIVLFDDIITTGKSMSNLRQAILAKGAASVDCVAFGRTV